MVQLSPWFQKDLRQSVPWLQFILIRNVCGLWMCVWGALGPTPARQMCLQTQKWDWFRTLTAAWKVNTKDFSLYSLRGEKSFQAQFWKTRSLTPLHFLCLTRCQGFIFSSVVVSKCVSFSNHHFTLYQLSPTLTHIVHLEGHKQECPRIFSKNGNTFMQLNLKDISCLGIRTKCCIKKNKKFTQPFILFIWTISLEGNLPNYHPFLSTAALNNKIASLKCVHKVKVREVDSSHHFIAANKN